MHGQEIPPPANPTLVQRDEQPKDAQIRKAIYPGKLEALDAAYQTAGIAKSVCSKVGHKIEFFLVNQIVPSKEDPGRTVQSQIVLCTQCGASLQQVRGQ